MVKRIFDIVFALLILILFFWLLIISWIVAAFDTKSNGIFVQERIGQFRRRFTIYKFRTIKKSNDSGRESISGVGQILRNYKLDELPQLFNILKGEMSFVGPRPDLPGYYDVLEGENKKIENLKPGLTSMASLKYNKEEHLLKTLDNPLKYNDTVIFPDKVRMNLEYYYNHSLCGDIQIIMKTVRLIFF